MSKPIIATYEASAHVSILITKISEKYRKYTIMQTTKMIQET